MKQAPGDLLDFMNQYYESGVLEIETEFEYDGTEFEEPDILPENNGCNTNDDDDDNGAISNNDNGKFLKNNFSHFPVTVHFHNPF